MLHTIYNPGPLALIIDTAGHLMDAFTWMTADPVDRTIARLLRRGALVDCGAVPEPEPPEE